MKNHVQYSSIDDLIKIEILRILKEIKFHEVDGETRIVLDAAIRTFKDEKEE